MRKDCHYLYAFWIINFSTHDYTATSTVVVRFTFVTIQPQPSAHAARPINLPIIPAKRGHNKQNNTMQSYPCEVFSHFEVFVR